MVETLGDSQIRKSSRKPVPKKLSDDYLDVPVVPPRRKYTKKQDIVKVEEEEVEPLPILTPQTTVLQKLVPSVVAQTLQARKSASPSIQPTSSVVKKIVTVSSIEEICVPNHEAKIEIQSPDTPIIKFKEPKVELEPECKPELMEHTDLVRRVPSKIAIHTGLRNTFAHSDPLVPRLVHPQQRKQPILRKVIIKPSFNQRNPINLKMVKPDDIVGKMNVLKGRPSPLDAGVGRLTLQKIANTGKPGSSNPPIIKPNVVLPVMPDKFKQATFYPPRLVVRPKFVYDINAKTVVPNKKPRPSCEPQMKRIKLEPREGPSQEMDFSTEEPVTFQSVFGTKYTGVALANVIAAYPEERLSKCNPALAARLAQIINYKKPIVPPKPEVEYPPEFPSILRPIGDTSLEPYRRQYSFVPFMPTPQEQPRPSGPVHVDRESFMSCEQSVTNALNDSHRKNVRVRFNGTTQDVPDEINCHLCGCAMRLCMRKSKYRGEIREYPAYRCLRKGCQTFRAIRKILEPDYAMKRLLPPKLPQNRERDMLNPDYILNSLMEMPESRKKAYSQEVLKEVEEEVKKEEGIANMEIKVELEDEQEEEVEWSDISNLETVPIVKDEIKQEVEDDFEVEYGSEHDSYESHEQSAGVEDDDDCFEVEDDTVE